jgi:hypothetical protein
LPDPSWEVDGPVRVNRLTLPAAERGYRCERPGGKFGIEG